MSEEQNTIVEGPAEVPKITKEGKKEKNPKRVEAGKRLAAISKAAKEKKKLERLQAEEKEKQEWSVDFGTIFGFVGFTIAAFAIWYASRTEENTKEKTEGNTKEKTEEKTKEKTEEKTEKKTNLESLD